MTYGLVYQPQWLTNIRVNYDLDTERGSYAIYGPINNLFDRNPSDSLGLSNIYGNIGRSYTVGASSIFDGRSQPISIRRECALPSQGCPGIRSWLLPAIFFKG
jgi:hypothetical protein